MRNFAHSDATGLSRSCFATAQRSNSARASPPSAAAPASSRTAGAHPHVGAFLRVPGVRLLAPSIFPCSGVDGPELPPAQAILRRDCQRALDLRDSLLRLPRLVQRPAEVALRDHPRLVERILRRLLQRRDRVPEAPALDVQRAQVVHRLGVVGPHLQRALELLLALVARPSDQASITPSPRCASGVSSNSTEFRYSLRACCGSPWTEQVVAELLVDLRRLRALLRGHPRAGDHQEYAEHGDQPGHGLQRILRLAPSPAEPPRPRPGGQNAGVRSSSSARWASSRLVQPLASRMNPMLSAKFSASSTACGTSFSVDRRTGVNHVLAALRQRQRHHHVEDRALADRHHRRLRRLRRCAPPAAPPAGWWRDRARRCAAGRREGASTRDLPAASAALQGELFVHVVGVRGGSLGLEERIVDRHRVRARLSLAHHQLEPALRATRSCALPPRAWWQRTPPCSRRGCRLFGDLQRDLRLARLHLADPLPVHEHVHLVLRGGAVLFLGDEPVVPGDRGGDRLAGNA